ncbi:hypothetical protein K3495_g1156 [Podosphaera aphanis]|nr:hypothetical protein K3495_g1156 [Podosphaera aphanis]
MSNTFSTPEQFMDTEDSEMPMLPPDLWIIAYLNAPRVHGPAIQLDPNRVAQIYATVSISATAPPALTAPQSPSTPPAHCTATDTFRWKILKIKGICLSAPQSVSGSARVLSWRRLQSSPRLSMPWTLGFRENAYLFPNMPEDAKHAKELTHRLRSLTDFSNHCPPQRLRSAILPSTLLAPYQLEKLETSTTGSFYRWLIA